jgi:hypothetical protein
MANKEQMKMQQALNAAVKQYNLSLESQKTIQADITAGAIQYKEQLSAAVAELSKQEQELKKQAIAAKQVEKAKAKQLELDEQLQDISKVLLGDFKKNKKALKSIGDQTANVVADYVKQVQLQMKLGKMSAKEGKQLIKNAKELEQMAADMQKLAKSDLSEPFAEMGKAGVDAIGDMLGQFDIFGAALAALQVGGIVGAFMLIVNVIKMAVSAATELSNMSNELGQNLGVSYAQAELMTNEMINFQKTSKDASATIAEMEAVQKSFMNSTGIAVSMTAAQADATADIGAAFGYSADQAGAINGQLVLMGMNIDEATTFQADMAKEAMEAGISTSELMEDIAGSADTIALYFGNNTKEMKRAAIEAKKMGMTLDGMASAAEGLLDFENSIAKEMEFQVLTGRTLQLDRARQLAVEGDLVGMSKELLNNFGSAAEFSKLDHFSKKAAAEAMGMTVTEMQTALNTEEARLKLSRKLSADQMKMAEELGLSMEELNNMSGTEAADAINNANEARAQSLMMEELKFQVMKALQPIGEKFIAIMSDPAFTDQLGKAFDFIGGIVTALKNAFNFMSNLVGGSRNLGMILIGVLGTIKAYQGIMYVLQGLQTTYNALKNSEKLTAIATNAQELIRQGYHYTRNALQTAFNMLKGTENALQVKGNAKAAAGIGSILAQGAAKLASAIAGIFGSFSMIPFGVGVALGAAAAATLTAMFMKAKAKKTGDLAMSANGGPIVASPKEGAIFQGTKNDEIAMGPGVIGAAAGGGGGAVTAVDMAPVVSAINELKSVITQISPVEIQMDGARIAEAVYATNSYKKR